jgi:hypothetical protein
MVHTKKSAKPSLPTSHARANGIHKLDHMRGPALDDRSIAKGDRQLEDLDISCRNLISRLSHPTYGRGASALLLMGLGGSSNSVVVGQSQSRLIETAKRQRSVLGLGFRPDPLPATAT